jgi:hypothetical protein
MSAADLVRVQRARATLVLSMDLIAQQFDALIMPTTKIVAPLLSESTTPEGHALLAELVVQRARPRRATYRSAHCVILTTVWQQVHQGIEFLWTARGRMLTVFQTIASGGCYG